MPSAIAQLPHSVQAVRLRARTATACADVLPSSFPTTPEVLPSQPNDAGQQRLEELLLTVREQLAELELRRAQSFSELQALAVELAVAAAGEIVHRALRAGDYAVEQIVQLAIEQLGVQRPITIELPPDDLQLLHERMQQHCGTGFDSNCLLRADPALGLGDCRATLPEGTGVLRDAATHLERIRELWHEELPYASVERRDATETPTGIQRFPDRRETA